MRGGNRYVAWMRGVDGPGQFGLGASVAIGEEFEVERVAREIADTPRWKEYHPRTLVSITSDPIRQRVVRTFIIEPSPAGPTFAEAEASEPPK